MFATVLMNKVFGHLLHQKDLSNVDEEREITPQIKVYVRYAIQNKGYDVGNKFKM